MHRYNQLIHQHHGDNLQHILEGEYWNEYRKTWIKTHQAGGRMMPATASSTSMPMMIPDDFSEMCTIELPPGTNTDTMPQ